ncbi:MAG: hypothetical protein EXR99_03915 [Gemmataceae bacterium]|nr:hypothetical protein [Gemmataceae bacterium]
MPESQPHPWEKQVRLTLGRFDERLLREVAQKLVRPRNTWPVEDLIDRCVDTLANPVLIDRRLKDLDLSRGWLLSALGRSGQRRWTLGQLVELAMALGMPDGIAPIFDLLETGFLFPDIAGLDLEGEPPPPCKKPLLRGFDHWLGFAGSAGLALFVPETVVERARPFELPAALDFPPEALKENDPLLKGGIQVDGLEIPLRLAVLAQIARENPPRINQQGTFFKRDLERFRADSLLAQAPADAQCEIPDFGVFIAELAEKSGLLKRVEGDLHFTGFSTPWKNGLLALSTSLWDSLSTLELWNPAEGFREDFQNGANPFPMASFLAMVALGRLKENCWANLAAVEALVISRHPYWADLENVRPSRKDGWLRPFLLGVAFQLGMVETAKAEGGEWIRLTAMGRRIMRLDSNVPPGPDFSRTLLVQPNLEIVAFRQGLTPELISGLTQLAAWKIIGPACQLILQPESVYQALEGGMRHEEIRALLERHSTRPLPQAVLDSLQTWANKHERIAIYASATLLEFPSEKEMEEALARGLPALRISGRFAVATSEEGIDFSHYKLTATRDYGLAPTVCVEAREDGVTLLEDVASSDLILETELPRFADFDPGQSTQQLRVFTLSPESLNRGIQSGLTVPLLEDWFQSRLGHPMTSACRLILGPGGEAAPQVEKMHVVLVANEEMANGLAQWPETAQWISRRLGPTALAVAEQNLPSLREAMAKIGLSLKE